MEKSTTQLFKKKKKQLLESWINLQLQNVALREDLMSNDELRQQSEEFLNAFIDALDKTNVADVNSGEFENVIELLEGISVTRAQQGFSPRETGIYIYSFKEALYNMLQKELSGNLELLFKETLEISNLLDSLGIVTFETFIKGREEVILRQTDEIAEISTPVIRVWQGILALPIIGTLDSARTQVVMESLLEAIVETESSIAILDISGVPAVDSLVAQHLIKTVSATRLMGAECVISGIRPEIAQTIVHLGIDLSTIVTKATLQSALSYAFSVLKLEVKRK